MQTKINGTWYTRVPYKRELGLTMREIKALCIANNGRLPRCGYEMTVITDCQNNFGMYDLIIMNISGTYVIHQYWHM